MSAIEKLRTQFEQARRRYGRHEQLRKGRTRPAMAIIQLRVSTEDVKELMAQDHPPEFDELTKKLEFSKPTHVLLTLDQIEKLVTHGRTKDNAGEAASP